MVCIRGGFSGRAPSVLPAAAAAAPCRASPCPWPAPPHTTTQPCREPCGRWQNKIEKRTNTRYAADIARARAAYCGEPADRREEPCGRAVVVPRSLAGGRERRRRCLTCVTSIFCICICICICRTLFPQLCDDALSQLSTTIVVSTIRSCSGAATRLRAQSHAP
jgi:hypothetical protein